METRIIRLFPHYVLYPFSDQSSVFIYKFSLRCIVIYQKLGEYVQMKNNVSLLNGSSNGIKE